MPSLFTLNKTSRLVRIIDEEWARHHYEENQKKFRESEVIREGDFIEENYESPEEDVFDFIEQQSTFCPSLSAEELERRVSCVPFADAVVYL